MNHNREILTSKPVLFQAPITFSEVGAMGRLLSAAVVDPVFCNLLLKDPQTALIAGYNGEYFGLAEEEVKVVTSIRAQSLVEYAQQLTEQLYCHTNLAQ